MIANKKKKRGKTFTTDQAHTMLLYRLCDFPIHEAKEMAQGIWDNSLRRLVEEKRGLDATAVRLMHICGAFGAKTGWEAINK